MQGKLPSSFIEVRKKCLEEQELAAQREQEKYWQFCSIKAQRIWDRASFVQTHPYLTKKRISADGLKGTVSGSLIIPLFISAFERSEQLADAMEARGYDPNGKRTRYHQLRFHWSDLICFILVGALFGGVIYLSIAHKNLNLIETIFKVEVPF